MQLNRWRLAVLPGALALACAAAIGLETGLSSYIERIARERLEALARASLSLAESRLEQAITALVDLAATGAEDCGPEDLELMRRSVFTTIPIKGLAVLDEQGAARCTHVGSTLEPQAISREVPLADPRLTVALVRFRRIGERAVRVRLERPNGGSFVALVAAESLLPDLDDPQSAKRLRLTLQGDEVIAARPPGDIAVAAGPDEVIAVHRGSDRYPIAILAERGLATLAGEHQDLFIAARIGAGLFVALMLGLAWTVLRQSNDPVAALRQAIANGEIVPYFQPTVDTVSGRLRGAEVLARWRRSDGTMVSPAQFIPLAEQSGLIYDLTRALMRRVRDEVADAHAVRPRLRLAFNLYAGHLGSEEIVDELQAIFADSPIALDQIVLEVTERAPLPDLERARQVIACLQMIGVRIAIDDVGTGHGGLSYLLKLGVDIIKIDKMFVDAISIEQHSQPIIETLVDLARSMNMEVIAEGVETVEQVEYLRGKGVHEAQGFVFAPPLPASAYLGLVEAMEPANATPAEGPAEASAA